MEKESSINFEWFLNGQYFGHHEVSKAFFERLQAWIARNSKWADVVIINAYKVKGAEQ